MNAILKALWQTAVVYGLIILASLAVEQMTGLTVLTAPNVNSTILVFVLFKVFQWENQRDA